MNTFLLTWNPTRWPKSEDGRREVADAIEATVSGGTYIGRWSLGIRKRGIHPGDRMFLVRTTRDRGVVARGRCVKGIYAAPHFDDAEEETNYVDVEWDAWLHEDDRLTTETLIAVVPDVAWNRLQASGVSVPLDAAVALEELWEEHSASFGLPSSWFPEEVSASERLIEGAVSRVEVNRYERNPRLRQICLDRWGTKCVACDFDFFETYGERGRNFMHVHHLMPLSETGERPVDAVKDLRPLCPNCHAMIHAGGQTISVQELKALIRTQ